MRKKRADGEAVQTSGDGRVTPEDVQQVEFRLSFRGYNERDVDAFLDRVTSDLSFYLEEIGRLGVGGAAIVPAVGSDVAGARGEAAKIVGQAREQAAAIVRQAEQQAAAIRAGAGAPTGEARGAVAPFLNTEREFLQQLGSLVQTHAEEIKQMVVTLRSRSEAPARTPASAPAAAPPPPPEQASGSDVGGASAAEIRERLGTTEEPATAERRVAIDTATEPAYSSEGAPAGDPRERSLRELFWGED